MKLFIIITLSLMLFACEQSNTVKVENTLTDNEKGYVARDIVKAGHTCSSLDAGEILVKTRLDNGLYFGLLKVSCDGGKFTYRAASINGSVKKICVELWSNDPPQCSLDKLLEGTQNQ